MGFTKFRNLLWVLAKIITPVLCIRPCGNWRDSKVSEASNIYDTFYIQSPAIDPVGFEHRDRTQRTFYLLSAAPAGLNANC